MILDVLAIFWNIVAPVFGVILLGYFAGPPLKLESRTLSKIAYYVFVPAYVFNVISTASVEFGLVARAITYIVTVTLACAAVGYLTARLLGRSREKIAAYITVAAFANAANFGIAIIEFKLGSGAVPTATLYFVAINVAAFFVSISYINWSRGGGLSAGWRVFKTPVILAIFPALFFPLADIDPPLMVSRTTGLLADAMIPVMLVALGMFLAEVKAFKVDLDVMVVSAVRLLAAPLLAILLAIPFGVYGIEKTAGILQAGMPAAIVTAIIAMEHDIVPRFVVTALFFSTACSLVTLTLLLTIV